MGRKSKIIRNSMFYSNTDYSFDLQIGLDYISQDINQTVMLFQVDRTKSNTKNFYGETINSDSIAYKEPIELNVIFNIDTAENKAYDNSQNVGRYLQTGKLVFGVYEKTLSDNNSDIMYGDYIGIQITDNMMRYWVVTNDGKINYDNKHTLFGRAPFYRTIECAAVDKNEFKGK